MRNRRILITGGCGFIGGHLAEKYLSQGSEVYIIDNLSTGSMVNVSHLKNNPEYSERLFLTVDSIMNEERMVELIATCDTVIHLAAAVGVKYILENPLIAISTNVLGTEIVLKYCNKFKKKVLISSTSEVYGKQTKAPLSENDDCVFGSSGKARWSYATTKLLDEFSALAYHRSQNLSVVIVRLFNTVGPRQVGKYGMVIPSFFAQARANLPLSVFGSGNQTRTFTSVTEVCDAMIKLIDTTEAYGQVVNMGGVEEITILELAQKIIHKTGSSSKISFVPYDYVYNDDFEDMPRRVPSTNKLKQLIGFAPCMTIDQILDDMILYEKMSTHPAD